MILWWTYQQLRASGEQTRLAVIAKLAESQSPDSLEPLLFALKDREPKVRSAAAMALGKRGDVRATEALIALLRDGDTAVRGTALRSLERLGWKPGDDSQRVQQMLAAGNMRQLASLGTKAVEPLLELIRNGSPDKQISAVKALGEIGGPRVSSAMQEALKKNNPLLRTAALGVLERLSDPGAYESIEKLLKDGNATVRGAAIEAAARCGGKRAVRPIVNALKDPSWEVRHIAVRTLGVLEDSAAVEGLCEMLEDSDHDVRESAITSLAKICDRRAIPFLVPMLYDSEKVLRAAAAAALRQINPQWEKDEVVLQMLPQIKAALDHNDYWVKHSAVKLFEQLGIDPDSIDLESESAKEPAANATPEHPAFSILADMLFDFDRDMRLAAAEALGRLQEKNAQPILAAAIHDEDRFVQKAAQTALAALN